MDGVPWSGKIPCTAALSEGVGRELGGHKRQNSSSNPTTTTRPPHPPPTHASIAPAPHHLPRLALGGLHIGRDRHNLSPWTLRTKSPGFEGRLGIFARLFRLSARTAVRRPLSRLWPEPWRGGWRHWNTAACIRSMKARRLADRNCPGVGDRLRRGLGSLSASSCRDFFARIPIAVRNRDKRALLLIGRSRVFLP